MARTVFRCARGTRVFAWAVIGGAILALIGLIMMLVQGLGHPALVITLLVLAVLGMIYLWRFALYPRIVVDSRLWVTNPLHVHILEANEVSDVKPGPNGLLIQHSAGIVEAWAVQKSSSALTQQRGTRADDVAEQILALLRSSPGSPIAPAPVASNPDPSDALGAASESTPIVAGGAAGLPLVEGDLDKHEPAEPAAEVPSPSSTELAETPASGVDDNEEVSDDESDGDDDLIIRRARPDDLDILVELERGINTTALAHVFDEAHPFPTDAVTERWDTALHDRARKIRVAELDGEPVGYVSYSGDQVHQLGIAADHSGRGHGRALLEYAVDEMAARGAAQARLQVLEGNERARGFYRHLGWTETGDRRPCTYPPHPVELTLELDLADLAVSPASS